MTYRINLSNQTTTTVSPADQPKTSRDIALALGHLMAERRAETVRILDVATLCGYTDYIVIATASSQPQMRGLGRDIDRYLHQVNFKLLSKSGIDSGNWAVLDAGDVIVHIFDRESRDYYRVEELWSDARLIPITI